MTRHSADPAYKGHDKETWKCPDCGKTVDLSNGDAVHTCSPQTPVPPHAAGEEGVTVFQMDLIAGANAALHEESSPAASQAALQLSKEEQLRRADAEEGPIGAVGGAVAPEMPEWMSKCVESVRSRENATDSMLSGEEVTLLWLADRVAELERESRAAECERRRLHDENQNLRLEFAKADTRIMDMENDLSALQASKEALYNAIDDVLNQ